jgi:hypothetical protein
MPGWVRYLALAFLFQSLLIGGACTEQSTGGSTLRHHSSPKAITKKNLYLIWRAASWYYFS